MPRLTDLDPSDVILLDPPTPVNFNVPNFAVAFAAAETGIAVVDQHTRLWPPARVLRREERTVVISVRPHTVAPAARMARRLRQQGRVVYHLEGAVDVQCCYPFVPLAGSAGAAATDTEFSDALPLPGYELFDSFNYMSANWRADLWPYPLLTSVGCPFPCTFCAARKRRWRRRSPDHCVAELRRAVHDHGIRRFEVMDDVFNLRTDRVVHFCELVRPLGLRWSCANGLRADRFDEAQARALADSGCDKVGFGVESIDARVLETVNKGETLEQIEAAVRIAKRYFDTVFVYLVIGLPGATHDTDLAGLRWAEQLEVVPNMSYFVDDRQASGLSFFGGNSRPTSSAYDAELQRRVYRRGRSVNKRIYKDQGLLGHAALATIRALPRYDLAGLTTHLVLSSSQVLRLALRGELQ